MIRFIVLLAAAWSSAVAAAPFAYITNQASHDVSVIDVGTARVVATIPVGKSPAGVVVSEAAGKAFVSNPDSKSISVIDLATRRVIDTLDGGPTRDHEAPPSSPPPWPGVPLRERPQAPGHPSYGHRPRWPD